MNKQSNDVIIYCGDIWEHEISDMIIDSFTDVTLCMLCIWKTKKQSRHLTRVSVFDSTFLRCFVMHLLLLFYT